jgi:hypothetical protein
VETEESLNATKKLASQQSTPEEKLQYRSSAGRHRKTPEDKGRRLAVVKEATPFQLEVDLDVDPQRNLSRIGEGAGVKTMSERLTQSRGVPASSDP